MAAACSGRCASCALRVHCKPTQSPFGTNSPPANPVPPPPSPVAEQWWSSQFLLPGATHPLSKEQQAAVTHTLAAWSEAVDDLPPDAPGTTAEHLQRAWDQASAAGWVC